MSAPSPSSSLPATPSKPRRPSSGQGQGHGGARSRGRALSSLGHDGGFVIHQQALASIRTFLKGRSSYDVFPPSFRLIVLDTKLTVKKALGVLLQNGVISAPLWNSEKSIFAGMLTVSDLIHLIQYYYHTQTYEGAAADVEHFRLENLRDIEKELSVPPPPLLSVHPLKPLFEASQLLHQTHARRLPLIDVDDQTGSEVVLSVLTQYRVLKFIAVNCTITSSLVLPLQTCKIGTYVAAEANRPPGPISPYWPLATATLQTTVFDVVHMFSERGISAVPIVDEHGVVVNLYETVDVITLVRLGAYTSLDLTISQALARRSPDFPGVVTCTPQDSLANLFQLIRKRRLHRLVVVQGEGAGKGRLVGIISLNDVLRYVMGAAAPDEATALATASSTPAVRTPAGDAEGVGVGKEGLPSVVVHGDDEVEGGGGGSGGDGATRPAPPGGSGRARAAEGEEVEDEEGGAQPEATTATAATTTTTPPFPPPSRLPDLGGIVHDAMSIRDGGAMDTT